MNHKLKARYGYVHNLKQISKYRYELQIFDDMPYRIIGFEGEKEVGDSVYAIDPPGGPFITVGDTLLGKRVKSITSNGIIEFYMTKWYYSKEVSLHKIPALADAQGNILSISKLDSYVEPLPRVTVATVYDPKDNSMRFGVSVCSPKDQFVRRVGRELAEKRAIENPVLVVKAIKRNKISETGKRYANELIQKHLGKYVQSHF